MCMETRQRHTTHTMQLPQWQCRRPPSGSSLRKCGRALGPEGKQAREARGNGLCEQIKLDGSVHKQSLLHREHWCVALLPTTRLDHGAGSTSKSECKLATNNQQQRCGLPGAFLSFLPEADACSHHHLNVGRTVVPLASAVVRAGWPQTADSPMMKWTLGKRRHISGITLAAKSTPLRYTRRLIMTILTGWKKQQHG